MMIEEFLQHISDNTIVVMYEPGAGGDFVCAQIALAYEIYGLSGSQRNINDGRVKSHLDRLENITVKSQKIFDDYEYAKKPDLKFEIINKLLDLENSLTQLPNNSRYISKVHPSIYFNHDNTQKLHSALANKYNNSKKVLVTRDETLCKQNHELKNHYNYDIKKPEMLAYSKEWYKHFSFIDESFEVYHINFGELMKNPLRTYIKLMNYLELTIDNKIIEKFREHISNYVDKQTFIEPFKRY